MPEIIESAAVKRFEQFFFSFLFLLFFSLSNLSSAPWTLHPVREDRRDQIAEEKIIIWKRYLCRARLPGFITMLIFISGGVVFILTSNGIVEKEMGALIYWYLWFERVKKCPVFSTRNLRKGQIFGKMIRLVSCLFFNEHSSSGNFFCHPNTITNYLLHFLKDSSSAIKEIKTRFCCRKSLNIFDKICSNAVATSRMLSKKIIKLPRQSQKNVYFFLCLQSNLFVSRVEYWSRGGIQQLRESA